jgi:hypothetical protein
MLVTKQGLLLLIRRDGRGVVSPALEQAVVVPVVFAVDPDQLPVHLLRLLPTAEAQEQVAPALAQGDLVEDEPLRRLEVRQAPLQQRPALRLLGLGRDLLKDLRLVEEQLAVLVFGSLDLLQGAFVALEDEQRLG